MRCEPYIYDTTTLELCDWYARAGRYVYLRQYIFCAYVTLEPCAHRGKTPSCAELLAELGLSRVVIGARDTNAQAAGGAEILRRGGIEVKFDVCHAAAAELVEPFYLARKGGFCFIKIKHTNPP